MHPLAISHPAQTRLTRASTSSRLPRFTSTTMSKTETLNVVPALVENGAFQELVDQGQTVSVAQSPYDGSLALFIAPTQFVS